MFFKSDDAEIFYEVRGEGAPVVLLHPFPVNHDFWLPAAKALEGRYRLILPDLRAHGASGAGTGAATMAKHAADVDRLCATAGVERAVFVGVSIGGYVLFEFWRRFRQRVRALALCNTRAQADTPEGRAARLKSAEDAEKQGPSAVADTMIPKLIGETARNNRPDVVQAARSMVLQMSGSDIAAVQRGMAERPDSAPTLATIDVPTLIVAGEEDGLTPVADAERMRQQIAGSRLQVIPKAGHYGLLEQPETGGRLLREFLDGLKR